MFCYFHRFVSGLLAVFVTVVVGCGGTNHTPPRASDPATARLALTTVLDTWKSGAASDSLASRTPQLFVGDEDWSGGHSLKDYKLIGDGEPFGNNVRFQVGLELSEKAGGPTEKTVRYVVATDPVLSVTRDDEPE